MFRSFVVLSFATSAFGFVSTQSHRSSTSIKMADEGFSKSVPFLKKPAKLEGIPVW